MTREEVESKLQMVENELKEIELTNDKSKRLRWRELNKIKKYYKNLLLSSEYHIEQQFDDIY